MTTLEALRQSVDIEEITKQVKRRRARKPSNKPREKADYLGVCFFDGYGSAWLYIDGDTRCIGKEKDVRQACKDYEINAEEPSEIKNAMIRWAREHQNHICHLRSEKPLCEDLPTLARNGRMANIKSDYFTELLDSLIEQDLGIWAIHSKLKDKGYKISMRTLGRRIRERKQLVMIR